MWNPFRTPDPSLARLTALETHVKALYDHIALLEREHTVRLAEHAAMMDQLNRLYKRMAQRVAREAPASEEESPLALRERLRSRKNGL